MESPRKQPERDLTDESLRTERKNTDRALADTREHIEETADKVLERARDKADAVLDDARDQADEQLDASAAGDRARDAVSKQRGIEDEALKNERNRGRDATARAPGGGAHALCAAPARA